MGEEKKRPHHVVGASCSRPSMERPAPCSEQTKNPSLIRILFLLSTFCFFHHPIRGSFIFLKVSAPRGRVALPRLERCPARCVTLPAGRRRSPFEEVAGGRSGGGFQKKPSAGSIFLHSAPRAPFIRPPTKQGRPGHGWIHPLRP